MWNWRMLLLTGDVKFANAMELTLYNAVLPGLSLDGQSYFYQNPLADDGTHRRQPWFGCACCPPNVARLLSQLPGYFYSTSGDDQISIHLYASNTAEIPLGDRAITLEQTTTYPWHGRIAIKVNTPGKFTLNLRVPDWSRDAKITVNGASQDSASITREWHAGDEVLLDLPMPAQLVEAHPHVAENTNRIAITRGPLVYCAETVDNSQIDLRDIRISRDAALRDQYDASLLNGATQLTARGGVDAPAKLRPLYGPGNNPQLARVERDMIFIPYYAWANRAPGRMQVWHRVQST
jgi:DUF1680 family protein